MISISRQYKKAMYKSSWLTILYKNHFNFGDRPIDQYIIFECKFLFSIIIFNFIKSENVQDRLHTHAFNSISIKIKGSYEEHILQEDGSVSIEPRINIVKYFERNKFHKIGKSKSNCWTILFAGPWRSTWREFDEKLQKINTLTWSRRPITTI